MVVQGFSIGSITIRLVSDHYPQSSSVTRTGQDQVRSRIKPDWVLTLCGFSLWILIPNVSARNWIERAEAHFRFWKQLAFNYIDYNSPPPLRLISLLVFLYSIATMNSIFLIRFKLLIPISHFQVSVNFLISFIFF